MLKVVLIGAGTHSEAVHGPSLAHYAKRHPDEIELAAVCDLREERARLFCEKFGFRRHYTDLDDMLDKEKPDACWVVTPISATRAVAGHVLERGVPCFLEKPPGASLSEAEELAEVSRRTGVPNMVGFNRRWAPCTRKAMAWAREHGPFDYLYACMLRSGRKDERFAFGTGIHLLDCVRSLGEVALGGLASARTVRTRAPADTFHFHVDLEFKSGAKGRCDILPTCGVVDESYALFGSNRSILYTLPWVTGYGVNVEGRADLVVRSEVVESEVWPAEPGYLNIGFYGEAEEFIAALCEGRRPSPSAEDAVDSVALADAVQEGREITFAAG